MVGGGERGLTLLYTIREGGGTSEVLKYSFWYFQLYCSCADILRERAFRATQSLNGGLGGHITGWFVQNNLNSLT